MSIDTNWKPPLFIVGASRSGTAMLRSILLRNPEISLAGETHYFDDLRPRMIGKSIREMSVDERNACADYFRALTVRPYGKQGDPEQSWLSREELLKTAEEIGDTSDSIFEAYCKLFSIREGGVIWGEKTPRHIFRINEILELFPQARVVCMVRDPRAVVASYRDWQQQGGLASSEHDTDYQKAIQADQDRAKKSYHIVLASLMWRAAANAAVGAQNKHSTDRVRIVKYEDVINAPEPTLAKMSDWLGISFDTKMLNIPLHNSSAMEFDEQAGISKAPQKRWRNVLSDREIGIIQNVSGSALENAGFQKLNVKTGMFDMPLAYASLPVSVIRAARANSSRFDSLPKYAIRRIKAVLKS